MLFPQVFIAPMRKENPVKDYSMKNLSGFYSSYEEGKHNRINNVDFVFQSFYSSYEEGKLLFLLYYYFYILVFIAPMRKENVHVVEIIQ